MASKYSTLASCNVIRQFTLYSDAPSVRNERSATSFHEGKMVEVYHLEKLKTAREMIIIKVIREEERGWKMISAYIGYIGLCT